jgi:hypothetical protein
MKRILANGSFEPTWRSNARGDADRLKREVLINRRTFLGGLGLTLASEYVAMRRAVAFPIMRGGGSTLSNITNARTGQVYQYVPHALHAMHGGDEILLPAGLTYQYQGATYYYSNFLNTNCSRFPGVSGSGFGSMYLGIANGPGGYGGFLPNCDYGAIEAVGSANNGRALLTPPYGILAQDLLTTDREMYFEASTPVSNFTPYGYAGGSGAPPLYILGSYNFGQFANLTMTYTTINTANNSLTGLGGDTRTATIPAGTLITSFLHNQNKGIFVTCGQNPGWTFTNLELAYAAYGTGNGVSCPVVLEPSIPGGPYVGSMTFNNCYLHDCAQGPGTGSAGFGNLPPFMNLFDTELTRMGKYDQSQAATHNIYCGHVGELLMDNCYSHDVCGTWLVKSRAALNILTYNQIRGERTDVNNSEEENSGCDFENGGLVYFIGNIHQQSLKAANQTIDYAASANPGSGGPNGTNEGGAPNAVQELYVINGTMVGPANGVGYSIGAAAGKAPVRISKFFVQNPEMTPLSQSAGGSLAARSYWVQNTGIGTRGGETTASSLIDYFGSGQLYEILSVKANELLTAASPVPRTAVADWNCYANYADPPLFLKFAYPQVQGGNQYFWNAGYTEPVFSQTSGGTLISCTGTLTNGSSTITGVGALTGLSSLPQLQGLSLYVGGTATGLTVSSVDPLAGTLNLNRNYSGSNATSFTFGVYLYVGVTYVTALGDSLNVALNGFNPAVEGSPWYDGSYAAQSVAPTLAGTYQVDPGNVLVVKAPPGGPSWAMGVNVWATPAQYNPQWGYTATNVNTDGGLIGLTKLNSAPVRFGGSFAVSTLSVNSQQLQPNMFLQNASPLAIGTNFNEPTTGLTNHNPTSSKLKWYRRAADGVTIDAWYAVVPPGGLRSYVETVYTLGSSNVQFDGAVTIWSGCASPPFDARFPWLVMQNTNSASVTTSSGKITVLASLRSVSNVVGTAGSGFTAIPGITNVNYLLLEYAQFSRAQNGLTVTETGGNSTDRILVDVLVGESASPLLNGAPIIIHAKGPAFTFTVPSAKAGDILYLQLTPSRSYSNVVALGQVGTPPANNAVGVSPICVIQNCIGVNFDSSQTGGSLALNGDTGGAVPSANITETTNLACNPFNGRTFGSPTFATVFADGRQSDFNYALASESPALNAASNPRSSPGGQDLVPHYRSSWSGSPTPGTPIPAKVPRSDVGSGKAGAIGALNKVG